MLNVISLLGLFAMVAAAWTMSSNRRQINWRLVSLGILLQFVFAAVFFNSQNWKFPRVYNDFDSLLQDVQAGVTSAELVPLTSVATNAQTEAASLTPDSFAVVYQRLQDDQITQSEMQAAVWPNDSGAVQVPRFPNGVVFYGIESFFQLIQDSVEAGSSFVFQAHPAESDVPPTHPRALLTTFAFGVLPTVVFFAALMSVCYYLGIMQKLIRGMAWVMQKTLKTSPSESLAAAANVLVGHTEAPLVVKPYVPSMTRSELNALMVGGFATISGSLMAIFASLGISAGHLLTASLISAPAALVIAKVLQPETETPTDLAVAEQQNEQGACNVIEAAANGATEGMKLAINIAAMLIAFLALIMFVDICLQSLGGLISLDLSLSKLFGWLFFPVAWVMGITPSDCMIAGDLLGKKLVVNEFLAYVELSAVPTSGEDGEAGITERTRTILTYALCGFSNFGAIGIQIGGIGPLAPTRKSDLAQLGLRAMIGGALAACMTACIAGSFEGWLN